MKFLADMGIASHTVQFLRGAGHDAIHLREEGLQRLGDEQIIDKARAEGRTILTHDLDFSRIMALAGSAHPSIITFRLRDMRYPQVEAYLSQVLQQFEKQLRHGALVSVNERAIRVRLLPRQEGG